MSRIVFCQRLKKEAPGMAFQLVPGELGKRIFDNISQEAWAEWQKKQTMLINEYRLSPINPKDRKFLVEEMEKFFFGEGASKIEGFKPV